MELQIAVQGWIRQAITADLNAFAPTRDWAALFHILPLGIVFGAVHALTPGTATKADAAIDAPALRQVAGSRPRNAAEDGSQ